MTRLQKILQTKFKGIEDTPSIETVLAKKFNKKNKLVNTVKTIDLYLSKVNSRSKRLYHVTLAAHTGDMGFVVKDRGTDLYRIIDEVVDRFYSKLYQLSDVREDRDYERNQINVNEKDFDEVQLLVNEDRQEDISNVNAEELANYPIVEKMQFPNNTPLHVEEAIRIMEINQRPFLLFRNISTGKYSVVYRVDGKNNRKKAGYGLIEPLSAN